MGSSATHDVTLLLYAIQAGDEHAADRLLPLVYEELRRLARARMARESPGRAIQPTSLVHEAYLRLVGDNDSRWANRAHFFAAAAEAMRRIVIDRARRAARLRHGGGLRQVPLEESLIPAESAPPELLAVDEALT